MATTTTNYGFTLPSVNSPTDENLWGGQINTNFTSLDALLKTASKDVTASLSGNTTIDATYQNKLIIADATSASFTITLLPAATAGSGFKIAVKKKDSSANTVTIQGNSTENIDTSNTYVLSAQDAAVVLISDGAQWWLTVVPAPSVSTATSSALGIVKPDNSTITISGGVLSAANQRTLGTPAATTSGTAVNISGIPSTAKIVTLNLAGVSLSGSLLLLQIGPSGGVATTGYASGATNTGTGGGSTGTTNTTGFLLSAANNSGTYSGTITLILENASNNTWCGHGILFASGAAQNTHVSAGSVSLSGALSKMSLTSVSGSATFSAGEINISYQ